jgi:2-polyprenyl-3-methyl-5-hydroxy-6-metoxy-1,4-benzoquinol methylase
MFENWQIKNGLTKFIRPKDFAINKNLENLNYKNAKNILDFGCADGVWLERILKGTKSKGIGVDISPDLIKIANGRKNKLGNYYNSGDVWPIKDGSIDFCFSFDVIEHLRDRKGEIKKLSKSIKKGGKILIFTLNPNDKFTYAWLLKKLGSDYLYKNFDHLKSRFVSPEKLGKELKENGFSETGFELYPGPFNLTSDVFCYGFLKVLENIFGKNSEWILNVNNHLVRIIYPVNKFLDKIFVSHNYSNGYFIWATKK